MRLKALRLENFRSYRAPTEIQVHRLTAFIGRNDAGKSTILEALEIFFEGETVKIDPGDASVGGDSENVRISAVFDNLPPQIVLDADARTSLADEYLLNGDGDLEIIKVYNCSVAGKVGPPKVFARAMHPTADGVSDLLQKKIGDLRKLVAAVGVGADCNQAEKPSMRRALYAAAGELSLTDRDVPLKDEDAKGLWEAVKRRLPVFALFRSDRASVDQDPEVQNPMKLAIQKALAELSDDLERITAKVQEVAEDTARRTIEQMQASYPDMALASVLTPQFRKPTWNTVFKLDLRSDDGIPLNKRGSGVRRLVLMSFFQAEAVRMRQERGDGEGQGVPVIYAIEEPETSQHPDHQERIVRAFRDLADSGDQVLLTTHVPGLAGLLPTESVRFVDRDPTSDQPRVRKGYQNVLQEVAETLGILPDAAKRRNIGVAVAVEGFTDIDALSAFAAVLAAEGALEPFDQTRVFWTIGGGTTLNDWVERRYLDKLEVPQVYIFDSDLDQPGAVVKADKAARRDEVNARPNCRAFISRKRAIENYMHPATLARLCGGRIRLPEAIDPDYENMPAAFGTALQAARDMHGNGLAFFPEDYQGKRLPIAAGTGNCKKIITAYIMRHMTAAEIMERGTYVDAETGQEGNEILEWLEAIRVHL